MITTSTGSDVGAFLSRIRRCMEQFSHIVLCSPFIDDHATQDIADLVPIARRAGCELLVITTEAVAIRLRAQLSHQTSTAQRHLISRHRLHAKFYLALARRPQASEVIVTSANLTCSGLRENVELGVRATGTSEAGCALLARITSFARRLAARPLEHCNG